MKRQRKFHEDCGPNKKRIYPSKAKAKQEAIHITSGSKCHGVKLHPYKCLYGDHWHLTAQEQRG